MLCTVKDGKCCGCGWQNWTGQPDGKIVRQCTACPHLGPPIERAGVTIKVKCGCNGKEHEQPHTAHVCTLYNRCLPTLVPVDMAAWKERRPESEIYHLCHGCDRGATG